MHDVVSHTHAHAFTGQELIEHNIVKFVHILRYLGLRVSTAEAMDSFRALELVDMVDAPQVRAALKTTLAKDPNSAGLFDIAFDAFFIPPEKKMARREQRVEIQEQKAKLVEGSYADLSYDLGEFGRESGIEETEVELTPEERETYAHLPPEIKDKFKKFLQKDFQKNPINPSKSLIDGLVKSYLNYWKKYLRDRDPMANPPLELQLTGVDEVDEVLEAVVQEIKGDNELLYEDMQSIPDKDIPKAKQLIKNLTRQLVTRISRRYHQSKKKRRVDLRRSIRHNIRFGGTMLYLQYKTRREQKPNLLLICDVSGSMARYASFVLQFIYGLSSVTERIESFVFSEEVERITPYFGQERTFEETMADVINRSDTWGKGTDIGKALRTIREQYRNLLHRDTFVIIVSDTKTVALENAGQELARFRDKVKEIAWLNTIPRREWKSMPAVAAFKKHSAMYECHTLSHLDRIMRARLTH